jgi:transposase
VRHDYHSVKCWRPSSRPPEFDTPRVKKPGGGRLPKEGAKAPDWLPAARKYYEEGASLVEVCERFDIASQTASRWLRWGGTTMRPARRKHALTDEQEAEVLRRYNGGTAESTLAKEYRVSREVILRILGTEAARKAAEMISNGARNGDRPPDPEPPTVPVAPIACRPVGPPKAMPPWAAEAARLYLGGQTLRQVADQFDSNLSRVLRVLLEAGVEIRSGSKARRFSPDEEKEIYELHRTKGLSRRAIAKRYGVGVDTIARCLLRQLARQAAGANGSDQAGNGVISGGAMV